MVERSGQNADLQTKHVVLLKEYIQLKNTVEEMPLVLADVRQKHEREVQTIQQSANHVILKQQKENQELR